MHKRMTIIFIFCLLFFGVYGQNYDSLINAAHPLLKAGRIPTYYIRGTEKVAFHLQELYTRAASYFERLYGKRFHVKLAVLDSAHWLNDIVPYGIIFYDDGWMVMNAGMSLSSFKKVYGMEAFGDVVDRELKKEKISGADMVNSFLEVFGIHELGHYYFDRLSNVSQPDTLTTEWTATYFSYQYFINNKPSSLPPFDLFCRLFRDNIKPKYTSIKDFNSKYTSGGIPTYGWYHVNFYFLVKEMYRCAGTEFIPWYERAFAKDKKKSFSTEEIKEVFDGKCRGVFDNWAQILKNTVASAN